MGTSAAGAAVLIVALVGLPGLGPRPFSVPAAALGVALFGAAMFELSFESRRSVHTFNITEVPLLIGMVFTAVPGLLVARGAGQLAYTAGAKRQPVYKVAFNISMSVLDTVVAVEIYYAILGHARPVSRQGWLAAGAAILGCQMVDWLSLALVIGMASGRAAARTVLTSVPASALVSFTNTCLALIAVLVLWTDPLGGILLAGVCVVLGTGYQLHQRLRRRAAVLARVHDFTQALDGHNDMEGVLTATLDNTRDILGAHASELWLRQGSGWLHYTSTDESVQVHTADWPPRLERLALTQGRGILVPRPSKRSETVDRANLEDREAEDAIAVPLQNPELEGVLTVVGRVNTFVTFTADDLHALEAMAAHAGVALHSALLLDKLAREAEEKEYQALHDALTGLPNRTLFATDVEAILALRAATETPQSAAIMLLDLDSFKEVNDTLGHGVGDVVLKVIASRLTAEIGERGVVARLGGDEYAVIVPVDDGDGAMREAEAVKRCVEEPIDEEGLLIEPRTSIGSR